MDIYRFLQEEQAEMQAHLEDEFRKGTTMSEAEVRELIAAMRKAVAEVPSYVERSEAAKDAEVIPISREAYEVLQSEAANLSYAVYESEEESRERLERHGMSLSDVL